MKGRPTASSLQVSRASIQELVASWREVGNIVPMNDSIIQLHIPSASTQLALKPSPGLHAPSHLHPFLVWPRNSSICVQIWDTSALYRVLSDLCNLSKEKSSPRNPNFFSKKLDDLAIGGPSKLPTQLGYLPKVVFSTLLRTCPSRVLTFICLQGMYFKMQFPAHHPLECRGQECQVPPGNLQSP